MSLDFMHRFQLKIHNTLSEPESLKRMVKGIYLSPVQDGNYPFILIDLLKAENRSVPSQAIYKVEFNICIFSKDKNRKGMLNISDIVSKILTEDNLSFHGYNIAGVKLDNLQFSDAKDTVHNKLAMHYRTMIKKVMA